MKDIRVIQSSRSNKTFSRSKYSTYNRLKANHNLSLKKQSTNMHRKFFSQKKNTGSWLQNMVKMVPSG